MTSKNLQKSSAIQNNSVTLPSVSIALLFQTVLFRRTHVKKGGQFINLINKRAYVGQNTKLRKGCVIGNEVSISCDITIGDFVIIQRLVDIGHDAHIGDYCSLGNRSFMGGGTCIGDNTMVHTGAIILPHVRVGKNCTVGTGAVVIKKVKDGDTVFGNPAKVLKF